jgi:hypothetical protein
VKLGGQHPCDMTVRWQRGGATDTNVEDGFKPDRTLALGEVVRLADLPVKAKLVVQSPANSNETLLN